MIKRRHRLSCRFVEFTCIVGATFFLAQPTIVFAGEKEPEESAKEEQEPQEPAQEEQVPQKSAEIDEIIVVGTHIKQQRLDGPSPILTLDRAAIERAGVISVADALRQLPVNNGGSFDNRDPSSPTSGGSGISLRGLGANAVLILVNGRRVVQYGLSTFSGNFRTGASVSFVDLNSIPIGAVEQIQVMKDGASAIYGSDAIAGVINIVLRDDFSGQEVSTRVGVASDEGAEEIAANAVWGRVWDRSSAQLIATYTNRAKLHFSEREISKSANQTPYGGSDRRSGTSVNFDNRTRGAECEERGTRIAGVPQFEEIPIGDDGRCLYDFNTQKAEAAVEQIGLSALLKYWIRPTLSIRSELSYLNTQTESQRAPTPAFTARFPASNPWNPFGYEPSVRYRFLETGPREKITETDSVRMLLALAGELGDWHWEVGALLNRADTFLRREGYLGRTELDAAMNGVDLNGDGVLQPEEYWNPYSAASNPNSQALADTLYLPSYRDARSELYSLDGVVSGPLMALPAGDLALAVGFEHRYESLRHTGDTVPAGSGAAGGFINGHQTDADREPTSIFVELRIPVSESVEVQTALRYEDYEDFGSTAVPRIAVRWQPFSRLVMRGSWGESFRAPSLPELYSSETYEIYDYLIDLKRCPDPDDPDSVPCDVQTYVNHLGNPNLQPVTSESINLGLIATPSDNLNVTLDYWSIDLDDRIALVGAAYILENEDRVGPGLVVREPASPEDIALGIPGPVVSLTNSFVNHAVQEVQGYDLQLDYHIPSSFGDFDFQMLWTHLASNKYVYTAGDEPEELVGSYGYPENRANLNMFWDRSNWQFGIFGRWTDEFKDQDITRDVDSHTEWDTRVSYSGFPGFILTLGIENIFDEEPPFATANSQGFPRQLYDMRGRFIYGEFTVQL